MNALPPLPADTGVIRTVPTSSRFRVVLDTNRYSVPGLYASQPLLLKTFADRLCIYHGEKLIATHTRSYDRSQELPDPEHGKELLDHAVRHATVKLLLRFFGRCPRAEEYYLQLKIHRLNPRQHIAKILALSRFMAATKSLAPSKTPSSSWPSVATISRTSSNNASASALSPARSTSPDAKICSRSNSSSPISPSTKVQIPSPLCPNRYPVFAFFHFPFGSLYLIQMKGESGVGIEPTTQ